MGVSCDHVTGSSLSFLLQFNMDVVKIEAFSFIRQEITHRLIIVSRSQNQSPLVRSVINTVIDYFSVFAPVENQSFRTLVICLAFNVYLSQL